MNEHSEGPFRAFERLNVRFADDPRVEFRCGYQEDIRLLAYVTKTRSRRLEILFAEVTDDPRFVDFGPAMALLAYVLSEAYFRHRTFEVAFVGKGSGNDLFGGLCPEAPPQVLAFAREAGVPLASPGHVSDREGRELYYRLSRFYGEPAGLLRQAGADVDRAAFLSMRGVWPAAGFAQIARHCAADVVRDVVQGSLDPLRYVRYERAACVLRRVVMADRLAAFFARATDAEAKDVLVEWVDEDVVTLSCLPGVRFFLSALEHNVFWMRRGAVVTKCRERRTAAVAVTADVRRLATERVATVVGLLRQAGAEMIEVPVTCEGLESEVRDRLARAGSVFAEGPVRDE